MFKTVRFPKDFSARAVALASLSFAVLVSFTAEAGFKKSVTLTGGRRTLENDTVYIVDHDLKVQASAGFSAYAVNPNSTAVLYIPAGKTLTLKGGAGDKTSGGEAGISLPAGATLIVTGKGTLDVTGGKAANGCHHQHGSQEQSNSFFHDFLSFSL